MKTIGVLFAFLSTVTAACAASAQASFPDRPVHILVGYVAGGPNDIINPIVRERLQLRQIRPRSDARGRRNRRSMRSCTRCGRGRTHSVMRVPKRRLGECRPEQLKEIAAELATWPGVTKESKPRPWLPAWPKAHVNQLVEAWRRARAV